MEVAEEEPKPRKRGRKPKIREEETQDKPDLEKVEQPARKRGRKPKSAGVQPELPLELSYPAVKKKRGRPSLREKLELHPELQPEIPLKQGACTLYNGPLHQPDPLRKPGKSILKKSTIPRRRSASQPAFRLEFRPGSASTENTDSDESADRLEVQPEFEVAPAKQEPVEKPVLQPESVPAEIADFEQRDRLEVQPELEKFMGEQEPTEKLELPQEPQPESAAEPELQNEHPTEQKSEQPEPQPELAAEPQDEHTAEQKSESQPEPQPELAAEPQEEHPAEQKPVSRRLKQVSIRYRTRPFLMRPLFKVKEGNGEDRTLIDDTLVDFYLTEYMVNDVYNEQQRAETHVFNSFFYTGLRDRIDCRIKMTPRRSELPELFKTLYPKFDLSLFDKKILVVPVHIHKPKHWLLVLIHNPLGATLRLGPPREPEKVIRGAGCSIHHVTKLLEDDRPVERLDEQCRIMLLDSLWGSEKFRDVLHAEYHNIFACLRFFVQMVAAARKEEAFSSKIKSVVCRVPRQKNHVDCGFFMIAFAEYYTTRFTEWTKWSLEALKFLPIDDFTKEHMRSNGPRESIDRLIASLTEH